MTEVLVIGHKNPDTDAICSAIGYAEFKRRTGIPNAVAARCGDINDRIDFVLDTFGVDPPVFVSDVSPKVRDVMEHNVISALPESTVAEAVGTMDERNIRVLPILDSAKRCKGLVSLYKMSKYFFPAPTRLVDSRRVIASVKNLAKTLSAKTLVSFDEEREEDLLLMIGAMNLQSFAKRLRNYPREKLIVIVGDRDEIQYLAIREKVRLVIVTGGLDVDQAIADQARENKVSLLISPHDTTSTAMLSRAAIAIEHVLHRDFMAFRDDERLEDVANKAVVSPFQAFPVIDHNQRMIGILSKSDFLKKVDRKLILVDHNELSQAVRGADKVEILEIIDHHRINSFNTPQPILFRNEPVGSTSTLVADSFFREHVEMPREIAGLLLAGVVSDTLNLTSPTTTPRDALVLKRLETLAGINAADFTEKLFASGSLLTSKPAAQAITNDCKEYEEHGKRFSVAQIEEIGFDQFWKRKQDLDGALESYRAKRNLFFSALLITDVVNQNSLLALKGDEQFIAQINYPEVEDGLYELAGVVSRKKQLLPYLIHSLEELKKAPAMSLNT